MNLCSIYKITNNVNGKVYIGQTWKLIKYRFDAHKRSKHCIKLYNAMEKHGRENFSIELITFCSTQETADYWEEYFIKKYDSINLGYNLREGGSHGKTSEETKRKLSIAGKGRPAPNKGIAASPETIAKLSSMRKGVKKSDEHRANMKRAQNDPDRIAKHSATMKNKTWKLIDGVRVYSNKIIEQLSNDV
jgi:group I intron endonuclease